VATEAEQRLENPGTDLSAGNNVPTSPGYWGQLIVMAPEELYLLLVVCMNWNLQHLKRSL